MRRIVSIDIERLAIRRAGACGARFRAAIEREVAVALQAPDLRFPARRVSEAGRIAQLVAARVRAALSQEAS